MASVLFPRRETWRDAWLRRAGGDCASDAWQRRAGGDCASDAWQRRAGGDCASNADLAGLADPNLGVMNQLAKDKATAKIAAGHAEARRKVFQSSVAFAESSGRPYVDKLRKAAAKPEKIARELQALSAKMLDAALLPLNAIITPAGTYLLKRAFGAMLEASLVAAADKFRAAVANLSDKCGVYHMLGRLAVGAYDKAVTEVTGSKTFASAVKAAALLK
jgi:hypothetical protein